MPGDADVGCDVDMVLDLRPVPQVVAAPDHHVVADLDRRLDGLVLQNEAIVTDTEVRPDDRTRADVGGKPVSGRLRAMALVPAQPVRPVSGERAWQYSRAWGRE